MKNIFPVIIFTLFFHSLLFGQNNNYTYGPIKESVYSDWIKGSGDPYAWDQGHLIGQNCSGSVFTTKNFNTWTWTNNDIPYLSTVTSVVIQFKAQKLDDYQDLHFSLHNINYPLTATGINFYNQISSGNSIYDATLTHDSNGMVYFSHTFYPNDGSGVCTALNTAIQNKSYFFTLAIQVEGSSSCPYWTISDYNNPQANDEQPSITLSINYSTILQNYQIANYIESSYNYGYI